MPHFDLFLSLVALTWTATGAAVTVANNARPGRVGKVQQQQREVRTLW
jgi:hypothetical protein